MFFKIDFLKNFTIFKGKHLCWSLLLIKFCNFFKKETPMQVFSCEYWGIFKNSFFIEHLRWLLLHLMGTIVFNELTCTPELLWTFHFRYFISGILRMHFILWNVKILPFKTLFGKRWGKLLHTWLVKGCKILYAKMVMCRGFDALMLMQLSFHRIAQVASLQPKRSYIEMKY